MSKQSSSLADKLLRRYRRIESTRKNIEKLAKRGLISQSAVQHMYESMFLNGHILFEGFLEDLFLGLLVEGKGCESSRPDVSPRIQIRSHGIARELVTGSRKKQYVDWFPFDRTIELASLFFKGGRPFSDLGLPGAGAPAHVASVRQAHKEAMRKCHVIRNAIAHKSKFSMNLFTKTVIASVPLPPNERSPAGYLRGLLRASPAQTRLSNLLAQLLACARDLSK